MDRNFKIVPRTLAEKEEIKAAVRGEAILVQTKRIPKNVKHPNPNFKQGRIHNPNNVPETGQQIPNVITVAHRIRIIKQRPNKCNAQTEDPTSSYIDRMYETDAYKKCKTADGDCAPSAPRKQTHKKNNTENIEKSRTLQGPMHPINNLKVEDTSAYSRGPIKNYKTRYYIPTINKIVTGDKRDINNNKLPRSAKKNMQSKRQTEVQKTMCNFNYKSSFSQNKLQNTQQRQKKRMKIIPPYPKQNLKRTSNRNRNVSSFSLKVDRSAISSYRSDMSVWKTRKFPATKAIVLKQKINRQNTKRNKNGFSKSYSSFESYRKNIQVAPPSSPTKASSRKKKLFHKSKYLEDENFYVRPSLCEKIKNWTMAKVLEAKIKRLIIFRERNKFSIPSDDENEPVKSAAPLQRGDEWLEYTGSDTSFDQDIVDQAEKPRLNFKYPEESYQLHMSLTPFIKILKVFGRLPFVVDKDQEIKYKMRRESCNYIVFCITTIFLTLIGGMLALEFIGMANSHFPQDINQKADQLIFDKYWLIGLLTLLNLLYTVLWSYSVIFRIGLYLEEYLTRWHLALASIKYSPDASVKAFVAWNQLFFALYCGMSTLLFFYGKHYWSLFWGNGELLAMLIFRRFVEKPRSHQYFFLMRIFGHFIYLYSMFCSRMITLLLLVHCRLVEMISRRWNLRLCCVLEKVVFVPADIKTFTVKSTVIPYIKLFAEHLVVTSFSRHTGKVFTLMGISYYIFKGITMFLSLSILAKYYLEDSPVHKASFEEGRELKILTAIFIAVQCWIGFLITSDRISKVGYVMMHGAEFVRRHGMALCKSSNERRFILSLQFAFAPVHNYYINFAFIKVDRPFIYKFTSIIFSYCVLAVLFSPVRWNIENVKQCQNGTCVYLSLARLFARHGHPEYRAT